MKRVRRILKILRVNAVLLAVGIAIIELAFGGWLDTRNLNRLNILKDRIHKYDVSNLYDNANPIITYSRGKYGLRGNHSTPGSIDMLTVGGSTTDQRYIHDGETWQDVLQRQFKQEGVTVIVANAGIDGQSTFGHIMNFKWWFPAIPGLAPEYILFYVGLNDFYIDSEYQYDRLLSNDESFSLRSTLSENSALWLLARSLRGTFEAMVLHKMGHRSINFEDLRWTRQALQSDYGFMQSRLNAYADRLRILANMTYEFGAKPVFVSQPSLKYRVTPHGIEGDDNPSTYEGHQINGVDYYHMMKRLDGVTKTVASEKDALFIDLAGYTDWSDVDFYDFSHMTPQGAKKVGTLLHETLRNTIQDAGEIAPAFN